MLAITGLAIVLAAPQNTVAYTFSSSLARFRATQWKSVVAPGASALPIADSPNGLAHGPWIYFDIPNNRVIISAPGDQPAQILEYIKQFDVVPKPIRMTVTIEQPDRGFKMTSVVETVNTQACVLGSPDIDGRFTVKPRINDDGAITIGVTLDQNGKMHTHNVRIASKGEFEINHAK